MTGPIGIDQLKVGDSHSKTVCMTQEMMIDFTRAIGDFQSFHQDPEMAKDSYFGKIVAPGMLTASLLGFVLGTEYPGLGTIYVSQDLKFKKPVFAGDELSIRLTVSEIMPGRGRVRLDTRVSNQDGELVLTGQAEIIPPGGGNKTE